MGQSGQRAKGAPFWIDEYEAELPGSMAQGERGNNGLRQNTLAASRRSSDQHVRHLRGWQSDQQRRPVFSEAEDSDSCMRRKTLAWRSMRWWLRTRILREK